MNALANVYNYSKDKSGTMFNYRKSKVEKEKKKETSWIQLFHTKYEETKNTSCLYIMNLWKIIKKGSGRIWVHLSFLKFNENPKYINFPWYKRVYFILKDQINQLMKIENSEIPEIVPVAQNGNVNNEMKAFEKKETEENTIYDKFIKYDSAVHSYYSQSNASKLLTKCDRFFKRTNSECINEKENIFPVERTLAVRENLPARYRTVSLFNGFMPFRNNSASLSETNDKASHVTENEETVSINEEQETVTVADNASDKVSDKDYETATSEPVTAEHNATDSVNTELVATEPVVTELVTKESATIELVAMEPVTSKSVTTEEFTVEEISATPRKNLDLANLNGLTGNIKKNLNIKSAWSKLSNFIA